MEIHQDIHSFLKENFNSEKFQEYLGLLVNMSESEFTSEVERDVSIELFVKTKKSRFLGALNNSETILLVLENEIKKKFQLLIDSLPNTTISIFVSVDKFEEIGRKYKDVYDSIQETKKDLERVKDELWRRVEERFSEELQNFLDSKNMPKVRISQKSLYEGYRIVFSETNVYVEIPFL